MNTNTIRIIGGRWRGRLIHFPDVEGLRPSGDRIRETVFNWLQNEMDGAVCLDLFAGTGVFGFEALSRGAESAVFIDENTIVTEALRNTVQKLSATNVDIIAQRIPLVALDQKYFHKKFNIVFIDPPFKKDLIRVACEWLESAELLAENALIYIESERELLTLPIPESWDILKSKNAGQVSYYLIRANIC
ncbi:MAG: 16S rRNA (guanine(966)-N(2))-methyltransferase RsmD [Pseudomonadota bacterium]|nr:16S rRNA (guanine(966)-N(2))-methyltransferase RsmD [Pseudomonadota bacterium]